MKIVRGHAGKHGDSLISGRATQHIVRKWLVQNIRAGQGLSTGTDQAFVHRDTSLIAANL
jgi:hypothetical protein